MTDGAACGVPADSAPAAGEGERTEKITINLGLVDLGQIDLLAAVLVIAATSVWVIVSIAAGFPGRWETIFQTLVAALTLAMVFVIQHTQARQQRAAQRKLDEILRALPDADNSLLTLEHASDDELGAVTAEHKAIRRAAADGRPLRQLTCPAFGT